MIRFIALLSFLVSIQVSAQNVNDILKNFQKKYFTDKIVAEIEVTVTRPKWKKTMTLQTWAIGNDYAAAKVLSPEKDKGTVFLKNNKEVWNYLPNIKKTVKMPMNIMSSSFMASDISTDEIIRFTSLESDYTPKIVGEELVAGIACHKIELTPKADKKVIWGKIILLIDKADYIQMKTELYDNKLTKVTTLEGSKIKLLGGKKLASVYKVTPHNKKNQVTTIEYLSVNFSPKLDKAFFAKANIGEI